jgi:uncharacterized membrane protein
MAGALALLVSVAGGAVASAQSITNLGTHPTSGQPLRPATINDDGTVVAGSVHDGTQIRAIRWTSGGGMQDLGVAPGASASFANGISGDGATIVGDEHGGASGGGAFSWTSAGGLVGLGSFGFVTAKLAGVSDDGATIAGAGQAAASTRSSGPARVACSCSIRPAPSATTAP